MLQAALQEEAHKASKAGASMADPFAGVQFKEVGLPATALLFLRLPSLTFPGSPEIPPRL